VSDRDGPGGLKKAAAKKSLSLGNWPLNPVFLKEILIYERGGSATPTRAAVLALGMTTIVLVVLSLAVYFPGPWRFAGRAMGLGTLALLAFASYGVMVPAATSIALERDRETFDTLTVSSLESGRMIRGKILGAFAIGLMTKAPLLPACGIVYLFGGVSISLFLAFLVVIVAVDFAYATLGVLISCKHHKPPRVQAFIKPPTQAQLALQRGIGLLVFSSVILLYGIAFLIPLSIQNGWVISGVLRKLAVLGISHPVLCLLFWGPVKLFEFELPLWLLCSTFHMLLAAPLYARAVQTHRPATVAKSRTARLLSLPLLGFIYFCLLGSLWSLSPIWLILGVSGMTGSLVLLWVVGSAFVKEPMNLAQRGGRFGMLEAAFFRPTEIFRSQVSSSPGYLLLTSSLAALVFGVALFHCYPDKALWTPALLCGLGFLSFTLGASLFGVRSNASVQFQEGEQLRKIIAGDVTAKEGGKPEEGKAEKGVRGLPVAVLGLSFLLPVMAWICAKAALSGALPMSSTMVTMVKSLGLMALALNPFAALLPVLGDPALSGHGVVVKGLNDLGTSPMTIYGCHIALYLALALLSVLFFPKAPPPREELLKALKERQIEKEGEDAEGGQDVIGAEGLSLGQESEALGEANS
jgi:hypothetical protein